MTEYECVGGPLDGEHLTLNDDAAAENLIEMNGWAYIPESNRLVWKHLSLGS